MQPDSARELKARIVTLLRGLPGARDVRAEIPRVAVGLAHGRSGVRVAVRLATAADRALLPRLGAAAVREIDVRVVGRIRALTSPAPTGAAPAQLRHRTRPLRPGLSVAHRSVTAGTLGGFVRVDGRLAIVSNNHVLAAADAGALGDPVLQPGPFDGGAAPDRVATLTAFQRFTGGHDLLDAAVAVLDAGVAAEPGDLPGGPLTVGVAPGSAIDPDELVEKIGRTTGHTRGRITAVEVDGVAVGYDDAVRVFDDQVEVEGLDGPFSAGGDSGSVIWRSGDRVPLALLFAGSERGGSRGGGVTFAHPLATVLSRFGAEWVSS